MVVLGFPGSSVGKEFTCNAGNPSLILGLGRSPREGIGYPSQYSQSSLVSQMVKNPSVTRETWVQSLGWEDPLQEGMATCPSILAWRTLEWVEYSQPTWGEYMEYSPHGQRSLAGYSLQGCRVGCDWATKHSMVVLFLVVLMNLHTVLHSGYISLHSHRQYKRIPGRLL